MGLNFNRIAYEALDVCNAVGMDRIEAAVALTGAAPGGRADRRALVASDDATDHGRIPVGRSGMGVETLGYEC